MAYLAETLASYALLISNGRADNDVTDRVQRGLLASMVNHAATLAIHTTDREALVAGVHRDMVAGMPFPECAEVFPRAAEIIRNV